MFIRDIFYCPFVTFNWTIMFISSQIVYYDNTLLNKCVLTFVETFYRIHNSFWQPHLLYTDIRRVEQHLRNSKPLVVRPNNLKTDTINVLRFSPRVIHYFWKRVIRWSCGNKIDHGGVSRISQRGIFPKGRGGTNLLFSQIFLETAWKWRKFDLWAVRSKFCYVDPHWTIPFWSTQKCMILRHEFHNMTSFDSWDWNR